MCAVTSGDRSTSVCAVRAWKALLRSEGGREGVREKRREGEREGEEGGREGGGEE